MEPLVSVLIPTRNRPKQLIKAVNSVLHQTYKQIEVIITDNSDSDCSKKNLSAISDTRIFYTKNSLNVGAILNWRKALFLSKGEFCLLLPDDDYIINSFYIEDAVEILLNQDVSMVITDCVLSYPNSNTLGTSGYSGIISGEEYIRNKFIVPHISNVFKRDIAMRFNAFHSNDILWSDIELWVKFMTISNVYCYNIPSIMYVFHNNNIVFNVDKKELIINSKFINQALSLICDDKLIKQTVMQYLKMVDNLYNNVDFEFIELTCKQNKIKTDMYFVLFTLFKIKQYKVRKFIKKNLSIIVKQARKIIYTWRN